MNYREIMSGEEHCKLIQCYGDVEVGLIFIGLGVAVNLTFNPKK